MRSSGLQKLKLLVKTRVLDPTLYIETGGRRLRRNRRFLRKVPTPACHDTPEDDFLIPDISSESTPTDIQEENAVIPECSDTSPTSNLNLVPEQRTSSGRLVRKPIRYREDL